MADAERRVLVVEDDAMMRTLLSDALTDEGYFVRTVADGWEGITTLSEWRPDLIVLDLMMPAMDGQTFRTAQRRVPETADIPVVVLSARPDVQAQARELGVAAVLPKPFDLPELLATIDGLLAQSAHG